MVENCTQKFLLSVRDVVRPTDKASAPADSSEAAEVDEAAAVEAVDTADQTSSTHAKVFSKLELILKGEVPIALNLEFLVRSNHTDLLILTTMKKTVEQRNSLCHSAIVNI